MIKVQKTKNKFILKDLEGIDLQKMKANQKC